MAQRRIKTVRNTHGKPGICGLTAVAPYGSDHENKVYDMKPTPIVK